MTRKPVTYQNETSGTLITFGATDDDAFTIIGDDSKVSDSTILALWRREKVEGWKRVTRP